MKSSVLFILALFAAITGLQAQSIGPATINAAGGTAVTGGNDFEWSVGEMTLVSTFSSASIVVTQGVLQPFQGSSRVPVTQLISNLNVFPNPATSVVNMQYTSQEQGTLTYRLMDMAGQVVRYATVAIGQGTTNEQVNIGSLACATYMLEVIITSGSNTPERTAYKIQKLQ